MEDGADELVLVAGQGNLGGDPAGRITEEAAKVPEAEDPEAFLRGHPVVGELGHGLLLGPDDVPDHVPEELLLALHVVVEAGLGEADALSHRVEGRTLEAHLGEDVDGGADDQVPPGFPAAFLSRHRGRVGGRQATTVTSGVVRERPAARFAPRGWRGRRRAVRRRRRAPPSRRRRPATPPRPRRRSAWRSDRRGRRRRRRCAAR